MCIAGATGPMRHAVFLDRDGVINDVVVRNGKPYPPPSPEELVILPGVPERVPSMSSFSHPKRWLSIGLDNHACQSS